MDQADRTAGVSVAMTVVGAGLFCLIDLLVLVVVHAGGGTDLSIAILLGLLVFGGSAVLLTRRSRDARGVAIGLLLGWAAATLASGGSLTGLA